MRHSDDRYRHETHSIACARFGMSPDQGTDAQIEGRFTGTCARQSSERQCNSEQNGGQMRSKPAWQLR